MSLQLDNLSIESAGLRGLPQLFLVEIERETGKRIPAAAPEEVLYGGDVLWFAGVLESVASLRKIPGQSYNPVSSHLRICLFVHREVCNSVLVCQWNQVKPYTELVFRHC